MYFSNFNCNLVLILQTSTWFFILQIFHIFRWIGTAMFCLDWKFSSVWIVSRFLTDEFNGHISHTAGRLTDTIVQGNLFIQGHGSGYLSILKKKYSTTLCMHTQVHVLSLIHIWRCRRDVLCRSRWSPYH